MYSPTNPPICTYYVESDQEISLEIGAVNVQEMFTINGYKKIRDELNSIPKWVRTVCKWFKEVKK